MPYIHDSFLFCGGRIRKREPKCDNTNETNAINASFLVLQIYVVNGSGSEAGTGAEGEVGMRNTWVPFPVLPERHPRTSRS